MSALSIILDIVLILISLVLIVAVLMQQGQREGLGAIAGGAETFFGKNKAKGIDAKLAKITKFAAVVFIVLAIAATIVVSHSDAGKAVDLSTITEELQAIDAGAADLENVEADHAEEPAEGETENTEEAVEGETEDAEEAVEGDAADTTDDTAESIEG